MPKFIIALLVPLLFAASPKTYIPDSKRAVDARAKVWPKLQMQIKRMGLKEGQPVYLRLFKDNHILELWMLDGKQYRLFDSYIICSYSGGLGTETKNGDGKCPEGYYEITPASLNPMSTYHLAMNIVTPMSSTVSMALPAARS